MGDYTQGQVNAMTQDEIDNALFKAVFDGNLQDVELLLQNNADPLKMHMVYADPHNKNILGDHWFPEPLLLIAAKNGHYTIVKKLLGIDRVRKTANLHNNGATNWAARNGHLEIVELLVEIDEVKQTLPDNGNNAMLGAIAKGHANVVDCLLKLPNVMKITMSTTARYFLNSSTSTLIEHFEILNRLLEIEELRSSLTEEANHKIINSGFYSWQTKQKKAILSAAKSLYVNNLPGKTILPILKRSFPGFSDSVLKKQIKFINPDEGFDPGRKQNVLTLQASASMKQKREYAANNEDIEQGPQKKQKGWFDACRIM